MELILNKLKIEKNFWPLIESVIIIGTETLEGKSNYFTCSWHSRVNQNPPLWGITIDHRRHSLEFIKSNKTFSINYPGPDLVQLTDYIGIFPASKRDKSKLFPEFKGTLKGAPMIENCIVNIELKVKSIIEFESDTLVIGEIIETYADARYVTDNRIDSAKCESFLLSYPDFNYHLKGKHLGKAWKIGSKLMEK